jgi:hypothetical protein
MRACNSRGLTGLIMNSSAPAVMPVITFSRPALEVTMMM